MVPLLTVPNAEILYLSTLNFTVTERTKGIIISISLSREEKDKEHPEGKLTLFSFSYKTLSSCVPLQDVYFTINKGKLTRVLLDVSFFLTKSITNLFVYTCVSDVS